MLGIQLHLAAREDGNGATFEHQQSVRKNGVWEVGGN